MTENNAPQIIAALVQQNELLQGILSQMKQPKLGFTDDNGMQWIYCNRTHNCLWYCMKDGEPSPITQSALRGYLRKLEFKEVERRGKKVWKLLISVEADRQYVLESGSDSNFAKGFLNAICALQPSDLKQPVTIVPTPGSDESVLFCRVLIGGEAVKASYGDETDWKAVAQEAVAIVSAAQIT